MSPRGLASPSSFEEAVETSRAAFGRLVGVPVASVPGIRSSVRAGRTRLAFHLDNTVEDVERVLEALS